MRFSTPKRLLSLSCVLLLLTACLTLTQPGTLSFQAATLSAGEQSTSVTVTVTRSGGSSGAVSVDYATADGTATEGSDYLAASGTLSWDDGDTAAKSFTITLLDDALVEGDETVLLTLSNPTGGAELGSSSATLTITDDDAGLTLDRSSAARNEEVHAALAGVSGVGATVTVGGVAADVTSATSNEVAFVVPAAAPAGPQMVTVSAGQTSLNASLNVLGDVIANKVTVILRPDVSEAELLARLAALGFTLERSLQDLGASEGPCAGRLADIDVEGTPLGQALEELAKLEDENGPMGMHVDPRSGYSVGAVDHLNAIGAPAAHARGVGGAGVLIAVLDTGVSPHNELLGRLRSDLAYDFIDDDAVPEDDFSLFSDGHGTPIAVLAAGSLTGVAPQAEVVGIKVCDATGTCPSNKVVQGVCHALTSAPEVDKLVLTLSLGGDTPVSALEAILGYALEQGALVAAAAGNQGESGSPPHYPAAHPLDGLLAVAAVEAPGLQCVAFEDPPLQSAYVVNDSFVDAGTTVSLETFFFGNGTPYGNGVATIEDQGLAGGSGQDINSNNINLRFAFPYPLEAIGLEYGDYGGNVNLWLNGTLANVGGITALPATVAGVSVTVTPDLGPSGQPLPTGRLRLEGAISSFAIGGQELWLDDVCPQATDAWAPAPFSTRGDYVDLSAPGTLLRSGSPAAGGASYALYEGTSFSNALAAGALALWREAQPTMSPTEIETKLTSLALELRDGGGTPFPSDAVGSGLLSLALEP